MKKLIVILISILFFNQLSEAQSINAPTECQAEMEDPFYIKVKWNDNSGNEDGFYVERATSLYPSNWETVGESGQNSRFFYDYWLTVNTKYYYRVYAFNNNSFSDYSNIDSIVATGDTSFLPARPTNLTVTNVTMTSITINWNDNSNNEYGFIIARRKPGDIAFEYIDTVATDVLTYQEVGLNPDNVYFYKVCSYNNTGVSDFSNTVSGTTKANTIIVNNSTSNADGYFLSDNYPNPFNPATNLEFGISKSGFVSLKIYDLLGKEVAVIANENLKPGTYKYKFNGSKLASGVYLYRMQVNEFIETKNMILIK